VTKLGRVAHALRARREERGSVIVEAAIIVPLLIMLTFGAIEYGLAFRDSASVASSTRAGARLASALTGQDTFAANASAAVSDSLKDMANTKPTMLVIYRANSNGDVPGGSYTTCDDCFQYTWNATTRTWTGPTNASSAWWTAAEQKTDACTGTLPSVGIYVKSTHTFVTALFGTSKTVDHKTVMRLEPIGSGLC
jgi:Flp pilus assembly protein TadG